MTSTHRLLEGILQQYPGLLRRHLAASIPAHAWHIDLVRSAVGDHATVVDVGGAVSLFSVGCAQVGMTAILMDDQFGDPFDRAVAAAKREALEGVIVPSGVQIVRRDIGRDGIGLLPESVDAITSFGVLEHLHDSPKDSLHEMWKALRPDGLLLIGTPNCANLMKRIRAVRGKAKWSRMQDWYERPVFRGHVREPDVEDLLYIARDLGIEDVAVLGRNWMGLDNPNPWLRRTARAADRLLRLRPQLCSDIYLVGRKRQH